MQLRQATAPDAPRVWELIQQARTYLRRNGVDQWQGDYPNRETVEEDVREGWAWLLCEEDQVLAACAVIPGPEASYEELDGDWLSQGEYLVLHRVAVDDAHRGRRLPDHLFAQLEALCRERGVPSLRTDTDRSNPIMQRVLARNGFVHCGTVLFEGSPRMAYEKRL